MQLRNMKKIVLFSFLYFFYSAFILAAARLFICICFTLSFFPLAYVSCFIKPYFIFQPFFHLIAYPSAFPESSTLFPSAHRSLPPAPLLLCCYKACYPSGKEKDRGKEPTMNQAMKHVLVVPAAILAGEQEVNANDKWPVDDSLKSSE